MGTMPIIPVEASRPAKLSEGMAALQMAEAHLATLITASDALDNKGAFLVAINAAFFGVLFGAIASSRDPIWCSIIAPIVLMIIIFGVGWWTVRHRRMDQFVVPIDMLALHMEGGYTDDELAWSYVETIEEARTSVRNVVNLKSLGVGQLAVLTAMHLVSVALSVVIWLS